MSKNIVVKNELNRGISKGIKERNIEARLDIE